MTEQNQAPSPAGSLAVGALQPSIVDRSTSTRTQMDFSEGRAGLMSTARRGGMPAVGMLMPNDTITLTQPSGAKMSGVPLRVAAKLGVVVPDALLGFVAAPSGNVQSRPINAPPMPGDPVDTSEKPADPNEAPADPNAGTDQEELFDRAETFATAEGREALDYLSKTAVAAGGDLVSMAAVYLGSGGATIPKGVDPRAVQAAHAEIEGILGAAALEAGIPVGGLEAFWESLGRQKTTKAAMAVLISGDLRPVRQFAREYSKSNNLASATDRVKYQLPSGRIATTNAETARRAGLKTI